MVAYHLISFLNFSHLILLVKNNISGSSEQAYERVAVFRGKLKFDKDFERSDITFGIFHKQVSELVENFWDSHLRKSGPEKIMDLRD
jgi:hypothetical protein